MLELLSGDWRVFPATLLLIGGVLVAIYGLALVGRAVRRPGLGPANSLIVLRGFRIAVTGIAIANIGAAWMWLVLWPLVFALVFIGEEMLEISFMIATVRQAQRGPVSYRRGVPPRGSLPASWQQLIISNAVPLNAGAFNSTVPHQAPDLPARNQQFS